MIRNYTWYNKSLDLRNPEAVQQVLAYGTIEEIEELKKIVGEETLRRIFLAKPMKIYRPANLNFVKKFILKIKDQFNDERYLKDTLRNP